MRSGLLFLNYAYFIGRTIALFNCLFSIEYYHGITSTPAVAVPGSKTEPAVETRG